MEFDVHRQRIRLISLKYKCPNKIGFCRIYFHSVSVGQWRDCLSFFLRFDQLRRNQRKTFNSSSTLIQIIFFFKTFFLQMKFWIETFIFLYNQILFLLDSMFMLNKSNKFPRINFILWLRLNQTINENVEWMLISVVI